MSLPESSMILLVPVGDEWSTAPEWEKDDLITRLHGSEARKELICHWLFNAKEVKVAHSIGDDVVETKTLHAGRNLQQGGEIIWPGNHPLPWMDIVDDSVRTVGLSADLINDRWLDDKGNLGDTFLFALVWQGKWYWAPGVTFEEWGSATPLGDNTFSVSGRNGGVAESFTYTIEKTFY